MDKYDKIVGAHPFWRDLDERYLQGLKESASVVRFGSGQPIFQAGTSAEYFYLIHAGRVGLEIFVRGKGIVTIQTIDGGEALGWSWLFPPHRWHFDARAQQTTDAVAFPAKALRDYADREPAFGYELVKRVANIMLERLQSTRLKLVYFYGAVREPETWERCS
jgi:CRP/FNR family transcriptional regulator, cyclic AMP receptor protein